MLKSKEKKLAKNQNNIIKTKKTFNVRELQLISHDNVTRFFDQSSAPILDKDGSIQGVPSISKDVTKRVNKKIQYQESRKMLEDLTQKLDVKDNKIRRLQTTLGERYHIHNLIGKNYLMHNIYNLIDRVSQTDSTILITVETGAIRDKRGKFELADKGTIFLDEIGELSMLTQVKLLRVLQERQTIERIGGEKSIKVDIRIIAPTNQDLLELIEKKKFRKDLFYRLNIIFIRLPSLKERTDDIPLLADHFIEKSNNCFKKIYRVYRPVF